MRRVLALVAALAVAAAVFLLRWGGILEGVPAVVFAVLVAVILPWSKYLSRRILLSGAVFLGWMPLLWWVKLPVPEVDRVGITLALVSGALAGWVLWAPGARARRLIPQVGIVDAMPAVAAAVAAWTTWPLIAASLSSGAGRSLNLLMKLGFDHVSHSSMVMLIRSQGAIVPMLGSAPDGSSWFWANYPQHFHATATALTELYSGSAVGDAATELMRYGRSLALVQVLTAALLAAGVAQLPSLRRRVAIAWPIAAMVVGAFLFGPGLMALSWGFSNFVLACATVGLAALLAVPMSGKLIPLRVFALGGLIVATVHGWALLAPLAIVAACVALVPFRRARWPRSRTGWLGLIAALALTVAASVAALPMLLRTGGIHALVTADWPVSWLPISVRLLLLAGGAAVATALAAYVREETSESAVKGVSLAAVPVTGGLLLGLLAAYQLKRAGELSYYFGKLEVGVTLICMVVLAAGVALHIGPPPPARSLVRRSVAVVASIVGCVITLTLLGGTGLDYRNQAEELVRDPVIEAERLLEAAAIADARSPASTAYVAAMPGDAIPGLANFWVRGLSLTWSSSVWESNLILDSINTADGVTVDEAAEATRKLLEGVPEQAVVVAPEIAEEVRELLPVELRDQVITWESP